MTHNFLIMQLSLKNDPIPDEWDIIRKAYSGLIHHILEMITATDTTTTNSSSHKQVLSSKIARVLTFTMLFMCASDMPPDIPMLFAWSVESFIMY